MSGWWAVVFLAVFLIGVTKSGFGSGVGLMIVPMTAIALDGVRAGGAQDALGLLLPLLILGDFIAVWQYRHLFSLNIVKHLLPGTLAGVVIGSLLLWLFKQQQSLATAFIKTEIGLESIALVSLHWWRVRRGIATQTFVPKPIHSHLTGLAAGVSSTLAHAAGPIVAMYLLPQRLDRQLFVGTCAIYFFLLNSAKVPGYVLAGEFRGELVRQSVMLAPLALGGAVFGFWVNRKLSDATFTRIVYACTFVLGWYILYQGIVAFLRQA
jgi:uncharacterized membrane protein YfcA